MNRKPVILYADDNASLAGQRESAAGSERIRGADRERRTQAVGAFTANPVDLALLDYHMPQMHGDVAASRMKTCKADVPSALMSAGNLPVLANLKAVDAFVCKSEAICRILDIVTDLFKSSVCCFSRSNRGGKLPSVQPERELRSSNCKLQLPFKHKIRAHSLFPAIATRIAG
jgi:CheY-like chemotaxis protein